MHLYESMSVFRQWAERLESRRMVTISLLVFTGISSGSSEDFCFNTCAYACADSMSQSRGSVMDSDSEVRL